MRWSFLTAFLAAWPGSGVGGDSQTLRVEDVLGLPVPDADIRAAYGQEDQQFGDLRLPKSGTSHPVAIVLHGGCWRARYNLDHISSFCAALTAAGIATWSLEYRRVGDRGGGWPGTFEDVARGTDYLRSLAREYGLDLNRVVAVGHSAGGQLALWLAARHRLDPTTPFFSKDPLPLRGVVALAAVSDLGAAHEENVCGDMVAELLGGTPDEVADRYRAASPRDALPLGVPLRLIHGVQDEIVPVGMSRGFVEAAAEAGDDAGLVTRDEAGHFELIAPSSDAWVSVRDAIVSLLADSTR